MSRDTEAVYPAKPHGMTWTAYAFRFGWVSWHGWPKP